MPPASPAATIDELNARAAAALAGGRLFEAERLACDALRRARTEDEFGRMIAVLPTLEKARLQRLEQACGAGRLTIIDSQFTDDISIEPGCYVIRPPLVGADARRLRLMAFAREIPVGVLCCEPVIRLGLLPIVAIANGATVRVKVDPPQDLDDPDLGWFADSLEALGEAATEIDPEQDAARRVDQLLARLDAIPEHEGLHRFLAQVCREAQARAAGTGGS